MNNNFDIPDSSGCNEELECSCPKVGDSPFFNQAYDAVHERVWPALYRRALDARLERAHDENIEAIEEAAEAVAISTTGASKGPAFEKVLNDEISKRVFEIYDAVVALDEDLLMEQAIAEASDYFITQPAVEAEIFRLENPEECE